MRAVQIVDVIDHVKINISSAITPGGMSKNSASGVNDSSDLSPSGELSSRLYSVNPAAVRAPQLSAQLRQRDVPARRGRTAPDAARRHAELAYGVDRDPDLGDSHPVAGLVGVMAAGGAGQSQISMLAHRMGFS